MNFPWIHTAGDTLDFAVTVPDYPSTDGWTLKYYLTPRFATPVQAQIVLTASANADGSYQVQESPANTALWTPGAYGWSRLVEQSGARQTLTSSKDQGEVQVRQDPATAVQGYDGRSQARKAVDDLNAAFATLNATSGRVKSYTIGSRQMSFETGEEIKSLLNYWQSTLASEIAESNLNDGRSGAKRLLARL